MEALPELAAAQGIEPRPPGTAPGRVERRTRLHVLRMTGRGPSGAQRGQLYHGVEFPLDGRPGDAVCGARPGPLSGWDHHEGEAITCGRCRRRLQVRGRSPRNTGPAVHWHPCPCVPGGTVAHDRIPDVQHDSWQCRGCGRITPIRHYRRGIHPTPAQERVVEALLSRGEAPVLYDLEARMSHGSLCLTLRGRGALPSETITVGRRGGVRAAGRRRLRKEAARRHLRTFYGLCAITSERN